MKIKMFRLWLAILCLSGSLLFSMNISAAENVYKSDTPLINEVIKNKNEEISTIQNKIKSHQLQIDVFKSELKVIINSIDSLKKENDRIKKFKQDGINNPTLEIQKLIRAKEEIKTGKNRNIDGINKQISELKSKIDAIKADLIPVNKQLEISKQKDRIAELNKKKNDVEDQITKKKAELLKISKDFLSKSDIKKKENILSAISNLEKNVKTIEENIKKEEAKLKAMQENSGKTKK